MRSQYVNRAQVMVKFLLSIALSAFLSAPIIAKTDASLLGDWEVTEVLMTGGMQPQWSMKPNDPRLMWRQDRFGASYYKSQNVDKKCEFHGVSASGNMSMRVLFEAEKIKRPKGVERRFYGRVRNYALGELAKQPVRLFLARCTPHGEGINDMGNWIAAVSDALIIPAAPDALMVLRRLPKQADPAQLAYCKTVVSASDKAICANRQLWKMYQLTIASFTPAEEYFSRNKNLPANYVASLKAENTNYVEQREACKGDYDCLYSALNQYVDLLFHGCWDCMVNDPPRP